jgi:hypothetical protein
MENDKWQFARVKSLGDFPSVIFHLLFVIVVIAGYRLEK